MANDWNFDRHDEFGLRDFHRFSSPFYTQGWSGRAVGGFVGRVSHTIRVNSRTEQPCIGEVIFEWNAVPRPETLQAFYVLFVPQLDFLPQFTDGFLRFLKTDLIDLGVDDGQFSIILRR